MAAQPIRAANEQNEAVTLWITGALLNKTFGFNKSSPRNSNKKKSLHIIRIQALHTKVLNKKGTCANKSFNANQDQRKKNLGKLGPSQRHSATLTIIHKVQLADTTFSKDIEATQSQ